MIRVLNPFKRYIIAKFLVIFVPVFVIFNLVVLYVIAERHITNAEDLLAVRIGNQMGRVSSLIAHGTIDDDPKMVTKLTSTLLADPAIICVDVMRNGESMKRLAQPKNLGCSVMKPESFVAIPVFGTADTQLHLGFSKGEIQQLKRETLWLALYTALFGAFGAMVIGIFGFRYAVVKPIHRLKQVMQHAETAADTRAIVTSQNEIGDLCLSFNSLQDKIATEQQRTQTSLNNLRNVYNDTPALLFTMNARGTILSTSEYWLKETGYSAEGVMKKPLADILTAESTLEFCQKVLPKIQTNGDLRDIPLCLIYRDGRDVDVLLSIDKDRRQNSGDDSYICVMNDVSQLRRAEERLYTQAVTDELTGLPNRRGLVEYFEDIKSGNHPHINYCAVLFIDLDNFKTVNDTHGHQVGDEVLRVSAQKLRAIIGKAGMVARIGGDEFAVVMASATPIENTQFFSKKIVSELSKPIRYGDLCCFIGASVGIAASKEFPNDLTDTLQRSDQAMYLAKRSGKNQTRSYDEQEASDLQLRSELVQLVQTGIVKDAFDVYFQPIIDLDTMRPFSFEALLRVTKPGTGPRNIETLIRMAEETGQMESLGIWIFQKSISNFRLLMAQYPHSDISLNINLSPHQLTHQFIKSVKDEIAQNPDIAQHLILEITETAAIEHFERACHLLQELRDIGIRIALDDFGSGYSSLSYLSQLPIDILKLDKSFLQSAAAMSARMDMSAPHIILVRALARLATDLGLEVVAEGIETLEMMENYHQLGVRLGQGYLFSKALNVSDMVIWLKPYLGNAPQKLKQII